MKDYICETDAPTIADYAAYCEFGQTELMGVFDFSKYPKVSAWLKRMKVWANPRPGSFLTTQMSTPWIAPLVWTNGASESTTG
ncbi:Glutathione transferase, theta class, partial [Globisporangium splendens]